MTEYALVVSEEDAGKRVDRFLADEISDFSRSYIAKLISDGNCLISGNAVKASRKLAAGERIVLAAEEIKELDILPVDIPIDILYEDEDVIVVNKPKGMPVHPSNGHYDDTLVNALMYSHKDSLSGINGILRPGIVHRIDMDTTGSLIVCKNDEAHSHIAAQISEHSLLRRYRGIVHGVVKEDGKINAPIGRSDKDRKKMAINRKNGKEAVTHYKVLSALSDYTYMEFELETGRTHQIRVHMASIGHPLLGDAVYGPKKCPFELKGQTLHAMTIGFVQPKTGEKIVVEAPLPEYFVNLLKKLSL